MEKTLHLHWLFDAEPPFFQIVIDAWKNALPDWQVNVVRGIQIPIPNTLLQYITDGRIPPPFRSDLFRYWYMYQKGGVYVDFDTLPGGRPLEELLEHDCVLLKTSFYSQNRFFVDNSLMVSTPGHPFWEQTILNALNPEKWLFPDFWFCGANCFPRPEEYGVFITERTVEEVPPERAKAFVRNALTEKGSPQHYFTHYRVSKYLGIPGVGSPDNPVWLDIFDRYPDPVDPEDLFRDA